MQSVPLPLAAIIVSLFALFASAYTLWRLESLNQLRRTLFTGATGENLESILQRLAKELKKMGGNQKALHEDLAALQENFTFAVQKIGLVRFNPFSDGGGNFSFSLALLNGHNTGVVLTSMHGRQQNRIYTKKITNGSSESPLTEEEKQAILEANQYKKIKTDEAA